jgi:plastocyanin
MLYGIGFFIMASLIVSLIFSVLAVQVFAYHISDKTNPISNATSTASSNNTIILNVAEVDNDENYRWVNSTGAENPDLNIISNTEYTIKIDNPTDEEHQLIIDSGSNGKTSEIGQSDEIKPGKNVEFKFKADQVAELGYHCKYHPEMMNGTINVS